MTDGPPEIDRSQAPQDFPQATPRDLYATSDIRFVMLKIGELATKVDHLSSLAEKQGDKLDELSHKVSFVKGATWAIGGGLALIGILLAWYFSGKLSITVSP